MSLEFSLSSWVGDSVLGLMNSRNFSATKVPYCCMRNFLGNLRMASFLSCGMLHTQTNLPDPVLYGNSRAGVCSWLEWWALISADFPVSPADLWDVTIPRSFRNPPEVPSLKLLSVRHQRWKHSWPAGAALVSNAEFSVVLGTDQIRPGAVGEHLWVEFEHWAYEHFYLEYWWNDLMQREKFNSLKYVLSI